jgi:hypothetical protein
MAVPTLLVFSALIGILFLMTSIAVGWDFTQGDPGMAIVAYE